MGKVKEVPGEGCMGEGLRTGPRELLMALESVRGSGGEIWVERGWMNYMGDEIVKCSETSTSQTVRKILKVKKSRKN